MTRSTPTLNINGKEIKLAHMRRSKKGANVDGARIHLDGLGTVYVQLYESERFVADRLKAQVAAAKRPAAVPAPPPSDVLELVLEVLKSTTDRLSALEDAVTRPIPNPRPSASA